jgi:hypothetical protein
MIYLLVFASLISLYFIVVRPYIAQKEFNEVNLDLEIPNTNFILISDEEIELLNSTEIPTDEEIKLYYKMYEKRIELLLSDNYDFELTPFEEWEKAAKLPSRVHRNEKVPYFEAGGYQYIIGLTCDTLLGNPPHHCYYRFHDYKTMVNFKNNS